MVGVLNGIRECREQDSFNFPEGCPIGVKLWGQVSEVFTSRIVSVGAFPDCTVVNLCVVVRRGKGGTVDRISTIRMLVANSDTVVRGGVPLFLRAPQTEVKIVCVWSSRVGVNEKGRSVRPIFIGEQLIRKIQGRRV